MSESQPQTEKTIVDRPTQIINTIVNNPKFLKGIQNSEKKTEIQETVTNFLSDFDDTEMLRFGRKIINGVARGDQYWGKEKRDGAIELFKHVDFDKVDMQKLLDEYAASVHGQDQHTFSQYIPQSLLQIGRSIAPHLTLREREVAGDRWTEYSPEAGRFVDIWNGSKSRFTPTQKAIIENELKEIVALFPKPQKPEPQTVNEALQDEDNHERLGWRERPDFDAETQMLHDKYLEVVKRERSFKRALWDNTPQFREECMQAGVDLAKFWNLSSPDKIAEAVDIARSVTDPNIRKVLERHLKQETGTSLESLTSEQSRFMADEIVKAAYQAKIELGKGQEEFYVVIDRLNQNIQVAKGTEVKNRKALLGPVVGFLKENGITDVTFDSTNLEAVFNDLERMQVVEENFYNKQKAKQEGATYLNEIFFLENYDPRYSFISRTRDDLFLGDLTGDCTAYHLNVGMNAWTVPVWFFNPGFNMFKIHDGDKLVAKAGVLLAKSGGEPALLIDSLEVGNWIKPEDEEAAKQKIQDGLQFLDSWAKRIGLETTRITVESNSGELNEMLEGVVESTGEVELEAIGNLDGIVEARDNLLPSLKGELVPPIYIQSTGEGMYEWLATKDSYLQSRQSLEVLVSNILSDSDEDEAELISGAARAGNWPLVFTKIVDSQFPLMKKLVGDSLADYEEYKDKFIIDEAGFASSDSDERILEDAILMSPEFSGEDEEIDEMKRRSIVNPFDDPIYVQRRQMEDFLAIIKQIEHLGVKPGDVLKNLYTGIVPSQRVPLKLSRRTPALSFDKD